MRQLSYLRKQIIRSTSERLRSGLLKKYAALLRFLQNRISARRLLRYYVIPGLFCFSLEASAQSFKPDTALLDATDLQFPARLATGDLDGDGDIDIVLHDYDGERLLFAENISTEDAVSFTKPLTVAFLPGTESIRLSYGFSAMGDLDSDGDLDILAYLGSELRDSAIGYEVGFAFLENDGTPDAPNIVASSENIVAVLGSGVLLPNLADMDGDGDLDLIGTLQIDELELSEIVYHENQNGIFNREGQSNPFGLKLLDSILLADMTVGDLDGDGDLDIIAFQAGYYVSDPERYVSELRFFENVGSTTAPSFGEGISEPFGLPDLSDPLTFHLPHLADIDGDGDLDLLAASYSEATEALAIIYYENDAASTGVFSVADPVEIAAFPNPTRDQITLDLEDGIQASVELYDVNANRVLTKIVQGNNPILNLHELPVGVYQGLIRSGVGELKTFRVVKGE